MAPGRFSRVSKCQFGSSSRRSPTPARCTSVSLIVTDADTLRYIHENKTAALLTAALKMGLFFSDPSEDQIKQVQDAGYHLGLAFQIVDDILDAPQGSLPRLESCNFRSSSGSKSADSSRGEDPQGSLPRLVFCDFRSSSAPKSVDSNRGEDFCSRFEIDFSEAINLPPP